MNDAPDAMLLEQFARNQSEMAFAALVKRHISLVYSVALRKTGNLEQAQDVTQAVFIILARKAGSLGAKTVLPGWLYHTARLTAANARRAEIRRIRHEQEAFMQSSMNEAAPDELWRELSPLLEDALAAMTASDRDALVLRYFQSLSLAEVGAALGINESVAQKRVSRALEKLRCFFARRGVSSTTAIIAGTISSNCLQTPPPALAQSVTAAALVKGAAASTSTLTLVKGALKAMAWTKAKTATFTIIGVIAATVTATVTVKKVVSANRQALYEKIFANPDASRIPALESAPPALIIRPTRHPNLQYGIGDAHGRCVYDAIKLSELIALAYGADATRVIMPSDVQDASYDYLNTLPSRQNEALREALQKQFGLVARPEIRPTDILLLTTSDPALLESFRTRGGAFACYGTGRGDMQIRYFTNAPLSLLADHEIEGYFQKPCILDVDPNAKYDFSFSWQEPAGLSGEARLEALRPVMDELLRHLGLELVPTNMPVNMLVVEKAG